MNFSVLLGYSLLTGLTAFYCVLLLYASGLWWSFQISSDSLQIPLFSLITLAPLPVPIWWQMIHWQSLAVLSLSFCMYWGRKRSGRLNEDGCVLPMLMHVIWILFAVCCHMLGAVLPMLSVGTVIL